MGCNVSHVLVAADLRGADNPPQIVTATSPKTTAKTTSAKSATIKGRQHKNGIEGKTDVDQIIRGNVSLECPSTARIVRIFTSSTFTDTRHERNTLMKCVYPKLKTLCQKKGYEFQVVDMRWGVRDEATDDHMAAELCLRELDLCKKISTGPCFVTFLSHKYGYRNFPREIESTEFLKLLDGVYDEEVKRLLLRWFKKDNNAIPSTYILQPISSQIPEFLANDEEKRKAGRFKWNEENSRMHTALIQAAQCQLGATRANKYAMSVTEAEINRGVISSKENIPRSLWFYRKIKNIEEQEPSYLLSRYTDCMGPAESVRDSKVRLVNLRDNELLKTLPRDNIVRYSVKWSSAGIDPNEDGEHKKYLDKLCEDFEVKLSTMINEAIQSRENTKAGDALVHEILQHTLFCQEKCRAFQGRCDTLKKISYYVKNSKCDQPLILHGESGCGKTSIMAAAVRDTWRVLSMRGNIIIRFLGTTPDSSSIASLLTSIILQIRRIYGVDGRSEMPMDIKELFQLFQDTLSLGTKDRPLALFFDSLDQLDPAGSSRHLMWLPRQLPENVKMVISTLTEPQYEIFPRLQVLFPTCSQYIGIPKLSDEEVIHILDAWLSFRRRQLTPSQRKVVEDAFQICPLPLFLKMSIDQACQWRSFTPATATVLQRTIVQSINSLLIKIESLHGKMFVSKALGYLTISKSGLSDSELEDVLSCDDDVLNELYTYWTPPIRRLPPLLLVRLKNELGNYLVDRGADNVRVFFWYHRLFLEAAKVRYCSKPHVCQAMHAALGDYFAGTWSEGKSKPFTDSKGNSGTAERHVASQPIRFDELYNLRKLNNLPFHRIAACQLELVKNECLCNFRFIQAKIKAVGVRQVLDDMIDAHAMFIGDVQLQTVSEVLQLSQKSLAHNPAELPSHIIGRIRRPKGLESLIAQCQKSGSGFLLPSLPVLNPTGGPLLHCLAEHTAEVTGIDITADGKKIVTCSNDHSVKVWDVLTGKLLHSYDNVGEKPTKVMLCYKNTIVVVETINALLAFEIIASVQQRFKLDINMERACMCCTGENKTRLAVFSGTVMKLRSARTGKTLIQEECPLLEIGEEFGQVCICAGCNTIAAVSMGNRVFLYDIPATQFYEDPLSIPDIDDTIQDVVACITFCNSGKSVVIGGGVSVTFYVIDIEEKTIVQSLQGVRHDRMASFAHVTIDDKYLITASWEKIVIWDLKTSCRYPVLKHPTRAVTNVASVDGNIMASIASDAIVRLWDLSRDDASVHPVSNEVTSPSETPRLGASPRDSYGQLMTPIQEIDDDFKIRDIYLTTNPRYVLLFGNIARQGVKRQFLRVFDLAGGRPIRQVKLNKGKSSYQVAMVGDRQALLVEWTGKVRLLDLISLKYVGQLSENIPQHSTLPQDLMVITHDTKVLTLSENRLNVKLFSLETCKCTETIEAGQSEKITCFVTNAAQNTLVAATMKGPYLVYDLMSQQFLYQFDSSSLNVKNFSDSKVTDDARYMVFREQSGDASHLLVWELKTRRVHARLATDAYELDNNNISNATSLRRFVILNNRTVLASYSNDTLRSHDLRSGQLIREVESRGGVLWICLQSNSPYVLTYNNSIEDNVIRLWDKVSLQCVASYSPDFRPVVTTMSKNGQCILAGFRQMSNPVIWRMCSNSQDSSHDVHWQKYPEIYGTTEIDGDLSLSEGNIKALITDNSDKEKDVIDGESNIQVDPNMPNESTGPNESTEPNESTGPNESTEQNEMNKETVVKAD